MAHSKNKHRFFFHASTSLCSETQFHINVINMHLSSAPTLSIQRFCIYPDKDIARLENSSAKRSPSLSLQGTHLTLITVFASSWQI